MGFTRPRTGRGGVIRYQALYDDVKGHRRSAGTFSTEMAADRAWQRAEARMAEGRMGEPLTRAAEIPQVRVRGVVA